ncbi:ABC transporter ATP-binding protein [Lachnoanaerobaculum sp. Marseille-Q4761]|jgi:ABC superfamily ATP binding cassette transporter, ABC/membrane protein|uniref:ABC transporter ATP-binding protein n=1 Tax=Lachnoanaerobaculum sp. Marseille-Q4761 TaxID=2819511 RepID=UPI001AA159E3|nr:ABC transporter ATP-binding protein [Lachnoanaerobaculum sp. Marseille-Q4761]MBO1870598.1 ABC transporter ATP-binding protein [Lachnoanaerobaculum sp. Marseille-Q4761]
MKKRYDFTWLKNIIKQKRGWYIISVSAAILGVFFAMAPYFIIGNIMVNLLEGVRDYSIYLNLCLVIMIVWIFRILFHNISTFISHKITFAMLADIRKNLCEKLYKLPLGYVKDIPSGSLKNIIVERVDSMEITLAHMIPELTANILGPVCIVIYLFFLDWRMALASLITVPVGIIAYMGMFKNMDERYNNTIVKTKVLNDTAVEYINGIEVIKVFGKAQSSYDKFVLAAKEGADCFIEWMRECIRYSATAMSLLPATLVGILPIGVYLYNKGSLLGPVFVLIIILSFGIVAPLITCSAFAEDLAKVGTIMSEISSVMEEKDMERPKNSERKLVNANVELRAVRFGYHKKEVLHGIDMKIDDGNVVALVGPSGSGKSTIAKLIAGLWDTLEGNILIGGVNTKEIPLDVQNKFIAYVSQDNYLFDLSIRENIRLGNPKASDKEVEEIAKKSGCHDFIMNLSDGYETVVGGAGGHLSGGERQRISIARAMLKDAKLIILDEATAYTDPENEALIQSAVAKLSKNKTMIVIAHRLSTIKDVDKIYVINDGKVEAANTHDELLKSSKLYKDMWEAHIEVKDRA